MTFALGKRSSTFFQLSAALWWASSIMIMSKKSLGNWRSHLSMDVASWWIFVITTWHFIATLILPVSSVQASGPEIISALLSTPALRQKHFGRLVISIASYNPSFMVMF